jgi:hypothetical protein
LTSADEPVSEMGAFGSTANQVHQLAVPEFHLPYPAMPCPFWQQIHFPL